MDDAAWADTAYKIQLLKVQCRCVREELGVTMKTDTRSTYLELRAKEHCVVVLVLYKALLNSMIRIATFAQPKETASLEESCVLAIATFFLSFKNLACRHGRKQG